MGPAPDDARDVCGLGCEFDLSAPLVDLDTLATLNLEGVALDPDDIGIEGPLSGLQRGSALRAKTGVGEDLDDLSFAARALVAGRLAHLERDVFVGDAGARRGGLW